MMGSGVRVPPSASRRTLLTRGFSLPAGRPPDAGYQSGYHGRPVTFSRGRTRPVDTAHGAPATVAAGGSPASRTGQDGWRRRTRVRRGRARSVAARRDATRRPDAAAALTTSRDDRANSPRAGGDRRREDRRSASSPAPPGGRAGETRRPEGVDFLRGFVAMSVVCAPAGWR